MFMNRLTRVLLVLLALGIQAVHAVQSEAVEQLFHGPWQVPRTGALTQVQAIIEVPATLMAPYRLHVQNGDGTGAHRVLSATIALNGTVVVFPREFYDVVLQPPNVGVAPVLTLDGLLRARRIAPLLVCAAGADSRPLTEVCRRVRGTSELTLLVGGEGGFTDAELAQLRTGGAVLASLGPRLLRTDTAAVAALAVVQALVGDWGGSAGEDRGTGAADLAETGGSG